MGASDVCQRGGCGHERCNHACDQYSCAKDGCACPGFVEKPPSPWPLGVMASEPLAGPFLEPVPESEDVRTVNVSEYGRPIPEVGRIESVRFMEFGASVPLADAGPLDIDRTIVTTLAAQQRKALDDTCWRTLHYYEHKDRAEHPDCKQCNPPEELRLAEARLSAAEAELARAEADVDEASRTVREMKDEHGIR